MHLNIIYKMYVNLSNYKILFVNREIILIKCLQIIKINSIK